MYHRKMVVFFVFAFMLMASAQESTLFMPGNIKQANIKGTRSMNGEPGPNYWQNRADYDILVEFDPNSRRITGNEKIVYFNNSPDSLSELLIQLHANIYKKGNAREFDVHPADETAGVVIETLRIDEIFIDVSDTSDMIKYIHNDFYVNLPQIISPQTTCTIEIEWSYILNKYSHMRTGAVDSSSFFIAYFFPRIAVYDDIDGWNELKYSGIAEFYNDFGDFDVKVKVPQHYVVWATGRLQNVDKVLRKKYSNRYKQALLADDKIPIISKEEITSRSITKSAAHNTWHFKAANVTDFAFATSDHYLWEATSLVMDEENDNRLLIDVAYNKNSADFYNVLDIAKKSIHYMSKQLPGIPFPYPDMTVFNGLDEMEYPMMVNDNSFDDPSYVIKLTSHEISHSYFPFLMGINETKYAWMDEGWASYFDYRICSDIDDPRKASVYYMDSYQNDAASDRNMPMICTSASLKRPVYHYNSYAKPAAFLYILHEFLGDLRFKAVLKDYVGVWQGKHPTPYDFFYCLNTFSGKNLDWLILPWFFEFGYIDLAIEHVAVTDTNYSISVSSPGNYPVPVILNIYFMDGTSRTITKDVSVWRGDPHSVILTFNSYKPVNYLSVGHYMIPDAVTGNNTWKIHR